ncbi:MAG: YdcF family protein [Candidatus Staskawiczbacteria bacterium]|nr:YdcF family protein [Candidatus Staskawiczbacteria bacterium]
MNPKEQFIILVNNESLKKSDAIIVLEGDGFNRLDKAIWLYKNNWSKLIVISGGLNNPSGGSYPAEIMKQKLIKLKIPAKDIVLENNSQNTKEQAENVIKLSIQNKWGRILIVASNYHQYRAFLTFLKEISKNKIDLEIVNAPASNLSWFSKNKWGRRIDLLKMEFDKINEYQKKRHLASFTEAINYLHSKENL